MKHIIIFLISAYQTLFSPLLKMILGTNAVCRFSVTCSTYAKQSILKYGVIKGGQKAAIRLLSCQPWSKAFNFSAM